MKQSGMGARVAESLSEDPVAVLALELRRMHKKSGVTLKQLERLAHVSDSSLSRYLAGRSPVPWPVVEVFCRLDGRDPRRLRRLWEQARDSRASTRVQTQTPETAKGLDRGEAAKAPAVNELPRDVVDFTGRTAELGRILADGHADQVTAVRIVAIEGMAGAGKTTLAIHAAHRLAGSHPDGRLYQDLQGYTPDREPVAPQAALRRLLGSLGVAALPEPVEELAALWRTETAGRRLLVVLDNAASAEQVRLLLPGTAGSTVLITSRHNLPDLDGADRIALDVLPENDAAALFRQAAGRPGPEHEAQAVAEVLRLCGHLPLAIRIAGSRLRNRQAWTVADLADLLRDERSRLAELGTAERSVATAFAVSERVLAPTTRRMFRLTGLMPGQDFDAYAAAALTDVPLGQARRLLEDLVDANLLQQPAAGRYRFHDLLRQHARDTAAAVETEPDRRAAKARLLDYYLHTAAQADRHRVGDAGPGTAPAATPAFAVPDTATPERASAWIQAERANLRAAVDMAADDGFPRSAVDLAAAGIDGLMALGHLHLALVVQRRAVHAAEQLQDPATLATALYRLGEVQRGCQKGTQAAPTYQRALELFRELGDRRGQANALSRIGAMPIASGDAESAIGHEQQALDLFRELGDEAGQAFTLFALGRLNTLIGRYDAAVGNLVAARAAAQAVGDADAEANVCNFLCDAERRRGRYPEALEAAERALALYREQKQLLGEANALSMVGHVRSLQGEHTRAEEILSQTLELAETIGLRPLQARALNLLGAVFHATGRIPEAVEALEDALQRYGDAADMRLRRAVALCELGDVRSTARQYQQAARDLNEALAAFRELGEPYGQADTLNRIGRLHLAEADPETAERDYSQALAIARDIQMPQHAARALEGIGNARSAAGDNEQAKALLRQALTLYQQIDSPDAQRLSTALAGGIGA